jgi:hypothetical protein
MGDPGSVNTATEKDQIHNPYKVSPRNAKHHPNVSLATRRERPLNPLREDIEIKYAFTYIAHNVAL